MGSEVVCSGGGIWWHLVAWTLCYNELIEVYPLAEEKQVET